MHQQMEEVTCSFCNFKAAKENVERLCSNCFGCVGCVRYNCPKCGGEIIEVPVQSFRLKKKNEQDNKMS